MVLLLHGAVSVKYYQAIVTCGNDFRVLCVFMVDNMESSMVLIFKIWWHAIFLNGFEFVAGDFQLDDFAFIHFFVVVALPHGGVDINVVFVSIRFDLKDFSLQRY